VIRPAEVAATKTELMAVSGAHEADICAGLAETDRRRLIELPSIIVSEQGLTSGGHTGMNEPPSST
jgi:hypothetical protein